MIKAATYITPGYPKVSEDKNSGQCRVSLPIRCGSYFQKEIWYSFSRGPLLATGDFILPLCLIPAMKKQNLLKVPSKISSRLLGNIIKIQDIFTSWDPQLSRVVIESEEVSNGQQGTEGKTALFFSAGVDSFYTLLRNFNEIDTLIFIHGFDIKLGHKKLRTQVSASIKEIAQKMGKELIEVETNLRSFSDLCCSWAQEYYGAALASVAFLLSPQFKKIYIASSFSYQDLFPWGSHPFLDSLWQTENLQIAHDGFEASRNQKITFISKYNLAMDHLRVCWENLYGAYNCCECEKCLRTMVSLSLAGALDYCRTFNHSLEPLLISRLILTSKNAKIFMQENLRELEEKNIDPVLAMALRHALEGTYYKGLYGWRFHALNLFKYSRLLKDWYLKCDKFIFKFLCN